MVVVVVQTVHGGWQAFGKGDSPASDLPARRCLKEIVLQVDFQDHLFDEQPVRPGGIVQDKDMFSMVSKSMRTFLSNSSIPSSSNSRR